LPARECVFCSIVKGEIPASIVHEDEKVLAFMDAHPVNAGHVLVIPKSHAANLSELDPYIGGEVFQRAMSVSAAVRASGIPCNAVNLILADGREAGQEVFHVHLHVIPRFRGDNFSMSSRTRAKPSRDELGRLASMISKSYGQ
jgi:histidine triad (HIT) family protein